jgi:hypothetical protein
MLTSVLGCETYQYKHDPSKDNYKNLEVTINGTQYKGVAVVPKAAKYEITLWPTTDVKRVSISSCHIDWVFEGKEIEEGKEKRKWYEWSAKGIKFTYEIQKRIEDKQACMLNIVAMNAENKPFDYFAADFLDTRPHVSMGAKMACNGKLITYPSGASICQAGVNTFQAIEFEDVTNFTAWDDESSEEVDKGPCFDALTSNDGKWYEFTVIPGQCTFYFTSGKKCPGDKYCQHRATFFGVTDYPFRGK